MKIDLHVHSKYSVRPSQWVLQRLGCHECYTEPAELYRIAKKRGMTRVTITDHNTINGCLEITELPDTFISEEVTAYFPVDGCKVHVLVYNIDLRHHQEIQKLRENIFDLVAYLQQERLTHALAHPLWSVNGRLTASHFEQLLLLFQNFELNGSRDRQLNDSLQIILAHLNPEVMDRLADQHQIAPAFLEPWRKRLTGGSDDHSSLNIARLHTEVAGVRTLDDFFDGVAYGKAKVIGRTSTPLTLSHNIYSIAYQFYRQRFNLTANNSYDPIIQVLDRALLVHAKKKRKLFAKWNFLNPRKKDRTTAKNSASPTFMRYVREELHKFIRQDEVLHSMMRQFQAAAPGMDESWFTFMARLSNQVLTHFTERLGNGLEGANLFDVLYSLTANGISYLLIAPYVASYSSFAQDRHFSRRLLSHFALEPRGGPDRGEKAHIAHFTDTFYEINGVALTLRKQAEWAARLQKRYAVITCDPDGQAPLPGVKNFQPLAVWSLPEYQEQKLFHPPFLEILDYCYSQNFTHVHAATPGPLGLAALATARLLQLPIHGTYHTALPQYAQYLTEDASIEQVMWRYVIWFYDQLDVIFVPSRSTKDELVDKGIKPEKIRIFPRGVDTAKFHPAKRNGWLATRHQIQDGINLLYVGRISKEKNLQLLEGAFKSVMAQNPALRLVVVGDGPYLEEMQQTLQDTPCVFTGYLEGEDLSAVYASSDLFVFPSATDTFGNVVLEAQASGIPVVVTDSGGPQENVVPGETGVVVPAHDEAALARAIIDLTANPVRLRQMGLAARKYMESRSFEAAFGATWDLFCQ